VKELGAIVENCSCVANDLLKIFEVYWYLGVPDTSIPSSWPAEYETQFNKEEPLKILLNTSQSSVYLSVNTRMS